MRCRRGERREGRCTAVCVPFIFFVLRPGLGGLVLLVLDFFKFDHFDVRGVVYSWQIIDEVAIAGQLKGCPWMKFGVMKLLNEWIEALQRKVTRSSDLAETV